LKLTAKTNSVLLMGLCVALFAASQPARGQESGAVPQPLKTKPAKPAEVPAVSVPKEGKQQPESAAPDTTPPDATPRDASPPGTTPALEALPEVGKAPAGKGTVLPRDRRAAFIIGPEDVLMIKVWEQGNLSGPVTVGPDGMISLQLIDEVKADGLTTEQLKLLLTKRLKSFIVNPDVNVQVVRVNSRKFILLGEVNRPGAYPLTGPTTIMEALVFGGGFREFANNKKIYVLRTEIDPNTKKPETKKILFNYKDVSHGKRMEQNVLVLNGDQIFVP